MVVIPTIIATKEKIKEMFDVLETFYLINKSENLYFTLLGDVKASNVKVEDYDKELSEYGKNYAENLNKKYKKDLFFFMYRKRVWNKHENAFLGYERKRGALLHFNKILLKEYIDETKYFNVNMLHDNDLEIKYVITLDADTKLVLNSALNLVGAMAHPMNTPVLNKEKTKVLMIYHNIYNSWAWVGGHADGEADLFKVIKREITEETGLTNLNPLSSAIYGLNIVTVNNHIKRGKFINSHLHLDIEYVFTADENEAIRIKEDENSGVKWLDITKVNDIVSEEHMKPIYTRLNAKLSTLE